MFVKKKIVTYPLTFLSSYHLNIKQSFFFNENRFHQSLGYKTPDEFYYEPFSQALKLAAYR